MISDKSSLASRLGWVLGETEKVLAETRQSFSTYVSDTAVPSLETAISKARHVLGVLDILDTEGAYMLGREIVLLMDAIRQEKVKNWQEACTITADGLLQLSEYLKHLRDGYADLPVIVLPMLNNLRAAREAELLSEHLVFLPAEGVVTNEQIGTDKYMSLPADKLDQATKRLRFYMQKALLGWFNNDRPAFHLQAARKVAVNMITLHEKERLRALWWVTSGLLQALEENKLEDSAAVKLLMGRMEREIRRFGDLQETAYNASLPDELLKNLLYYVGLAEESDGTLGEVKQAYHLDLYLPKGGTLQELRTYYTKPGRELWQAVSSSLQDELALLMSQVESLGHREHPTTLLGDVAKRTGSLAQTLGMLGLGTVADLTDKIATEQQAAVAAEQITSDLLERMSEHYIKLESVLREYAETGYDRTEEIFFGEGQSGSEMGAAREVVRTALTSLAKAQAELAAFHQEEGNFAHLDEISKVLRNISGTLEILGHQEIQPLAQGVKAYLAKDLQASKRKPALEEIHCVADIMTLLEAALSCISNNEDHLPLLPVGFEKLHELDNYTKLDLVHEADLVQAQAELEHKKKAKQQTPSTLYQKLRNQRLLTEA
ncbi:hypothetical protein [uncultured Thiothrix sp.]|uniref:hypothetical protein n=1 Tax=uncultured Thiothrix sp. TaxID=223185 RepID=UPI002616C825|nr:hypothetical protein [uncultured Thiothrix sp.]